MKAGIFWKILFILFLFTSCSRTPEAIISKVYSIDIRYQTHETLVFEDQWYPNGDGHTTIKVECALTDNQLQSLAEKGGHSLPIVVSDHKKSYIERLSGMKDASNGIYIYEEGDTELEFTLLMYDRNTNILFYYLAIQ